MRIERLGPDDDDRVAAAEALFDDAIDAGTTRAFLADDGHHLLIAVDDGSPAGFVTGVELLHPDKPGPEMFLYELGVDEAFRGRGIGRALVEALTAIAWERGCYGMWVLTDEDNAAAMATYRAAGGRREPESVMFVWDRPDPAPPRRSR
jgi:ribosomal protein S18 acetylase RimI-like enzyme